MQPDFRFNSHLITGPCKTRLRVDLLIGFVCFLHAQSVVVIFVFYRIPNLDVTKNEKGEPSLELRDDPFDCMRVDVAAAPCLVTLNKVMGLRFW